MTVTLTEAGKQDQAAAATSVVDLASGFAAGDPRSVGIGDVIIVVISRDSEAAITPPAGWNHLGTVNGAQTTVGAISVYWRQMTGAELTSYTWNFTSCSRKTVAYWVHSDQAGSWASDAAVGHTGSDTSNKSYTINSSGTLAQAEEFAICGAVLNGNPNNATYTIDSGFTRTFSQNNITLSGHEIVAATTALQPTFDWAPGLSSNRAKACGMIASFRLVAAAAKTDNFLALLL